MLSETSSLGMKLLKRVLQRKTLRSSMVSSILSISKDAHILIGMKFIGILRFRLVEIQEKSKNNARLKLHQDLEFL